MSNQVVTIGYLKTFVNGVISVNTTKSDSYCPTYAELTGGTLVQNYSAGTNPTNYKPGIKIPSCTVGIGYTNDQLVIRQDLQLLWYVLQSVDVSASTTTISCCSGSSTLSTTAYFNLSTKKENATTTATTNTSTVVTASYSDDKSYTTINGSKITFSKNSVNYPSYTSAASRSTTVTSTYQYSGVTKTDTVTITQSANSVGSWTLISDTTTSISVSPSSMSFDSAGGSKSYSVTRYYTSYYERYDSCDTLIDTDTDSNSASVTPTGYNCTGGFTCTSSKVSCNTNNGSSRTGTLTVTWGGFSDTCSLSQGASQAGTTYGEPYNYNYNLYVTSPKSSVPCSGGTEQFTARYVTTWDYDWVTKDAAGNVTNSGTSSDSSSTDVTNSASWSTTRGSVSSKGLLTYGASTSDNRITYTVSATYNGYSDSSSVYQEGCSIAIPCMTIYYTVSGLDSPVTVYFKTNGTQEGSHTVSSQGNQSLCNIAENTPIQVTCSDTKVTVGGDVEFIFKSGTTANISLTKSTLPSTPTCNVPSGTFAGDYDFRVDFSEAVTSDLTVYIDEKDGNCNVINSFEVTVSKGKKSGYGNNVLVQNHTFVTAAYFEITDVKPNSDTTYYYWGNGCEYDDSNNCTEIPDLCTCGVISISVTPSSYEFTSSTESKTFSVTIVDNECTGCTRGFKVYNSSGTYVTSGTTSFTLSNQSGTFTIRANDDTGKTCTLTTTAYTAPVSSYKYSFKNCYTDRQIGLFASNATPSGANTKYIMLNALDGTTATVLVTSNNGTMVNGSSSSAGGTAKIGDSVKLYSVTNATNIWTLEETITLTASDRSFEYGCSSTPTSCTCSVTSISVYPTTHTFTSNSSKSFSVTIVDNDCDECEGGFKVYNSSGTYVTSGTSSFSLSNQSDTFTIKANDDTRKTCTLTTTAYVDNSCTCSVTSISVTPSSYEFTSSTESKSFSVTIVDNNCSGCTGGFKVYNSSGTYVTSGTSSFSLSNQSGTFTIKANDDTRKTCTLTTTAYTAPASTCVIGETITSNGGNGSKITVSKGGTKTLTIYTKEDGMFSMVSVVPDIYDSELVTISNTASSQTECHTTWVLTASNSKTGSTDITFRNGCGEYVLPFEVTAATCQTSITYNSITATVGTVGKCSTSATFTVTANGTKTNTNCTTATTSTTLTSSNYTVKYGKTNGSYTLDNIETNETNSEVTWYYKITASSTYGSKTVTGSFKQEKGNCTPIYVFKFNNPTDGFDSTSTETHIIHKPVYEGVGPTTTLTSTKDGSNVGYTMSSNVNWITTSTASTTCSWNISKNTSTSSRSGTITLTQSGSNKTLTISVTQGGAPVIKTCNPLFLSYDDTLHKMTATFDEMVSSDVTINFKVNVNNSAIITDSIKISEGNNSNTKTLSTSQSITSTAGTSISISSINPSSDSEYKYNCDTDWEIIPSTPIDYCVNATVKLKSTNTFDDSDLNSSIVHNICPDDNFIEASGNFYYGFGYMDHNHTFDIDFSIEQVGASIQTIECSANSGIHSGEGSFGFTYNGINPDEILQNGGVMTISGTYTFLDGVSNRQTGNYLITITLIEI